jgi:hypothetical protein
MSQQSNNYIKRIENEKWSSLAYMAITLKINIKENGHESRRLKKELWMLKHVIYDQLQYYEEMGVIPYSFFVGMFKTIKRVENSFERVGITDKTFLHFLKVLFHKAKKERIVAIKPLERMSEFRKMKSISERYDYLRGTDKN